MDVSTQGYHRPYVLTRLDSPVAPGPALEGRAVNPAADSQFTLGDLCLLLGTFRAFAASTALSSDL